MNCENCNKEMILQNTYDFLDHQLEETELEISVNDLVDFYTCSNCNNTVYKIQ